MPWKRLLSPLALNSPDTSAPSQWQFSQVLDGGSWNGVELFPEATATYSQVRFDYWKTFWTPHINPRGFKPTLVAVEGKVPQVRKIDGSGLIYPGGYYEQNYLGQKRANIIAFIFRDTLHGSMTVLKHTTYTAHLRGAEGIVLRRNPWHLSFDFLMGVINTWDEWDLWNSRTHSATAQRLPLSFIDSLDQARWDPVAGERSGVYALSTYGLNHWSRYMAEAFMSWKGTDDSPWPPLEGESENPPYRAPMDITVKLCWRGGQSSPEDIYRVSTISDAGTETESALSAYRQSLSYYRTR